MYDVEVLRDGNSFSARRVAAIQNGKPIFYMTASFQAPEPGYEHQKTMPPAPSPDTLKSETDIARALAHLLPPQVKEKFLCDKPLEIRPVEFHNPMKGHTAEPKRQVWIRANGTVPEDFRVHQYLLGYASDFNFLPVALQPHGVGFLEKGMQVATIDHSMWFHRPFNMNEWLLYSVESTSASSARGFVRGEFYTQDGVLVELPVLPAGIDAASTAAHLRAVLAGDQPVPAPIAQQVACLRAACAAGLSVSAGSAA